MNRSRKYFGFLLFGLVCPSAFAQLLKPGPELRVLQQIQGTWRDTCRAIASGSRYQQTKLIVGYTHFVFATDEFSEPDCRIKRTSHQARYRFVLREPLITQANEEVFAIDFQPEEVSSGFPRLYPLNIIKYERGTLRLGSPPVVETSERLQRLDREQLFSR